MEPVIYIVVAVYVIGIFASMNKISAQVDKHPELDNPVYAVGGLIASLGSWGTYCWMVKQDKNG